MKEAVSLLVLALLLCSCSCNESQRSTPDTDNNQDASADSGVDDSGIEEDAGTDGGTDASPACSMSHSFEYGPSIEAGSVAGIIASADFNDDEIMDIVYLGDSDSVYVRLGIGEGGVGDGTFSDSVAYYSGESPSAIGIVDFNQDCAMDLAVTNFLDNTVSVFLGNSVSGCGDGTFSTPYSYQTGEHPYSIDTGDLNEDGIQDIVVTNITENTTSILFGNGVGGVGDGTFAPRVDYGTPHLPGFVEIADYNSDGIPDIAIAGNSSMNVRVLLGNGSGGDADGTFVLGPSFSVGDHPHTIVAEDFNDDGNLDLSVSNYESNDVSILLGTGEDGDLMFEEQVVYAVGVMPFQLSVADVDGDGILDIAVGNVLDDTINVLPGCGEDGVGDGSFGQALIIDTEPGPNGILADDFDGDDLTDLIVANESADTISILLGSSQ